MTGDVLDNLDDFQEKHDEEERRPRLGHAWQLPLFLALLVLLVASFGVLAWRYNATADELRGVAAARAAALVQVQRLVAQRDALTRQLAGADPARAKQLLAQLDALRKQVGGVVATGLVGPPGPPGTAGLNGLNGTNGVNGTNGRNGTNGLNGRTPRDGTNGTNGTNGGPGPKGDTGGTGPPGPDECVWTDDVTMPGWQVCTRPSPTPTPSP